MAIPMLKIRRPLTWKSPYVDKTVFILRRGPVSYELYCLHGSVGFDNHPVSLNHSPVEKCWFSTGSSLGRFYRKYHRNVDKFETQFVGGKYTWIHAQGRHLSMCCQYDSCVILFLPLMFSALQNFFFECMLSVPVNFFCVYTALVNNVND